MTFDQPDLFNHQVAAHNGSETSREAAETIKPHINALALKVLTAIRGSQFGLTCDEAEAVLNMKHQTCSARFRELSSCEPPYIIKVQLPDGKYQKRNTRSGSPAFVFIANQNIQ